MRIGLLGGSFDPVHVGHIAIATEALETLNIDAFYFIPTKNNPWKELKAADGKDRVEMLKIAIHGHEKMGIDYVELNQEHNEKNYTIDTIHDLQAAHPENKYFYLMGMDQVCSFDKWKDAQEISELVQLVAFNRGGYPVDHSNLEAFHFIKMENSEVIASSTEIKDGNLTMLDPDVLRYISSHGLYLEQMIKKRMSKQRYIHTLSVARLTESFALANKCDPLKGYIAGMMHDVAKEMDHEEARKLMEEHYPEFIDKPRQIWHQWLSRYVCTTDFLIEDEMILKAIEDHTTGSLEISELGKCLYCADKLDPSRGYDSSHQIGVCMKDIDQGFRDALNDFYDFSKKNNRSIDPCFFDIYNKFVKGVLK